MSVKMLRRGWRSQLMHASQHASCVVTPVACTPALFQSWPGTNLHLLLGPGATATATNAPRSARRSIMIESSTQISM